MLIGLVTMLVRIVLVLLLVRFVMRFVVSVTEVSVTPLAIAQSALLGIGATLLSALAPAFEATGAPPRAVLSRGQLEVSARRRVVAKQSE